LDVQGAYVHDLKAATRESVPVDKDAIEQAEATVSDAIDPIKARDYGPNPGLKCRRCEVRKICPFAKH
jgi:DNA helicase-2/ATP-dependent DNA helicase PcrA